MCARKPARIQPEGHAAGTTDGGGGSRSTRCRPRAPTAPPLPGYPQAPHRLHLPSPAPASPPRPAARRPAPPGPARPPPHGPAPLAMSLAESCLTSSGIRSHWHSERHRSISVSSREPAFLVAMAGPMGPGGGRGRGGGSGREGGGGGGGERTAAAPGACAPGAAELEGCGPRRAPRQRRHLPAAAGTRAGPASQPPRGAAASGGGRGRRDALREDAGRAPWQPGERGPGPGLTCGKRGEPAVSSVHLLTHTDTHRSRCLVCSTKHKSIFALNGPPLLHNFSSALPQGFGRYVSHCHADTSRSTLHAFTPSYTEADLSPASPCWVLTSSCPKSGGRTARV